MTLLDYFVQEGTRLKEVGMRLHRPGRVSGIRYYRLRANTVADWNKKGFLRKIRVVRGDGEWTGDDQYTTLVPSSGNNHSKFANMECNIGELR